MSLSANYLRDASFLEIIFVIIVGWMLVGLWEHAVENIAYESLGLSRLSSYHSVIVAGTITLLFMIFVFAFNTLLTQGLEENVLQVYQPPEIKIGGSSFS